MTGISSGVRDFVVGLIHLSGVTMVLHSLLIRCLFLTVLFYGFSFIVFTKNLQENFTVIRISCGVVPGEEFTQVSCGSSLSVLKPLSPSSHWSTQILPFKCQAYSLKTLLTISGDCFIVANPAQ